MPTKFTRKKCVFCGSIKVVWKMRTFRGRYMCPSCISEMYSGLMATGGKAPDKYEVLHRSALVSVEKKKTRYGMQ